MIQIEAGNQPPGIGTSGDGQPVLNLVSSSRIFINRLQQIVSKLCSLYVLYWFSLENQKDAHLFSSKMILNFKCKRIMDLFESDPKHSGICRVSLL